MKETSPTPQEIKEAREMLARVKDAIDKAETPEQYKTPLIELDGILMFIIGLLVGSLLTICIIEYTLRQIP